MKFSLRHIALFFAFAGLVLALIGSRVQNAALESEMRNLRDAMGYRIDFRPDEDEYRLSETGDNLSQLHDHSPTYLLRVENFKDYRLEVTHYAKNSTKVLHFDISDPLIAISYVPDSKPDNLFIRSTLSHNLNTFHTTRIGKGSVINHSNHGVFGDKIGDGVIFSIFLGDEGYQIPFGKPEFQWQLPVTLTKVKRLCDTTGLECISFRLVN